MRKLKFVGVVLFAMVVWLLLVPTGIYFGWFSRPWAQPNDTEGFFRAAKDFVAKRHPPVFAFALIRNGQLYGDYYSSAKGEQLNADTLFPLASMSKWFTAYGVAALSDRGKLDLDRPVEDYLTRWHLPQNDFDNRKVTTRLLLGHRAGIHDGLGFGDYLPTETLPSLEESLTHPRASSGKPVRIAVTSEPGTSFDYSGGSFHLLELVVEEVSGNSFEQYMDESVFKPLGMTRANYQFIGGTDNGVRSYTVNGEVAPQYQYASSGATALNASIHDMTQFLRAQVVGSQVKGVVAPATLAAMRQPQSSFLGVGFYGSGVILSTKTAKGNHIYGHDGANEPAINSSAKINPDNGDAVVALVNGHEGLATALASNWAYWQTGRPDWFYFIVVFSKIKTLVLSGWAVILLIATSVLIARRKNRKVAPI